MAVKIQTLTPVTVTNAGTAVQLSSQNIWVTGVTIQAEFTNVGKIVVGSSGVANSAGIQIPPGDVCDIEGPILRHGVEELLLSEIYINSTSNGDGVRAVAFIRRD